MKINNRIIVILVVAVFSLLVALALISHFFILSTFSDIEQKQAVADMQRVLTRLNDEVEDVAAICREWAQWDDTYSFVNDLNPGYVRSNLAEPSLFRNLKINYVLFFNSSGELVYSRGYNHDDGSIREVPPGLLAIVRDSILPGGSAEGVSGRRGYSLLDGQPVILAGYRITRSDLQGEPAGTLVMVRQLDPGRISEIAQQTDLDIMIRPVLPVKGSPGAPAGESFSGENDAIRITTLNASVIEADATITGIENTPTRILVSVQSSRLLYQQVQASVAYLALAIILLALVLIIVIRWPLKKYIVNPLLSLDSTIKDIGRTGEIFRQVTPGGDDEIVSLGNTLNRMLEEITRAQGETVASESKFRTLTETSLAGIFVYRKKILYANHAAEIQTGYSREELSCMDFTEIVHPDYRDRIRDLAEKVLRGDETNTNAEFKIIRKDGGERWIDSSAAPFDYEGEKALLAVRVDITERKRMEEALRINEEKFRALIENTPDIVFSADVTGIFTYVSPQVENYGFCAGDLVGKSALDFVFPDDWQVFGEHFVRTLEDGRPRSTPFRILDRDQNLHWMEANFAVTRDREGVYTGLQGTCRDITERRKTLDAITLANRKLNLMYDITRHDILNKITILFGLIDMTHASSSTEEREQYLKEIGDAGQAIWRQISLTRDYQEVGVKSPRWNSVREVIAHAIANFSGSGVQIRSDVGTLEVYADPLFEKVMYNLVDNALRYGAKITTISFYHRISDKGLELVCEDDGVGIEAGSKEKIFERGFGNNTGLGLFLTREILMITGIAITEQGKPGNGARFVISLPRGTFRFSEQREHPDHETINNEENNHD